MPETAEGITQLPIPESRSDYMGHVVQPNLNSFVLDLSRSAAQKNVLTQQFEQMQAIDHKKTLEEEVAESSLEGEISGMKTVLDKISPPASEDMKQIPPEFSNNMAVVAQHLERLKINLTDHDLHETATIAALGKTGQVKEKALLQGKIKGIEDLLTNFGQSELISIVNNNVSIARSLQSPVIIEEPLSKAS